MKASLTLITTSYPITANGSEAAGSFVADFVEALAEHIEVRVVAPGPVSKVEIINARIRVYRYAAPVKPLSTLKPWNPSDVVWAGRVMRGGLQATRHAAKGSQHILALWALPCGEWARRVAIEAGTGYSVWMLGSDIWSLGKLPILRAMLKKVICQAQHAYADGLQLGEDAKAISGRAIEFLPSTRAIQLRNPPLPRSQPPYRLLFLGRWHHNKGVDLLLEALLLLDNQDWAAIESVEIQGGGPMQPLVKQQISQLQNAGHPVKLGGFLAKKEAEQAIVRNDWLLIPSRIESIPVVFSDAMKLKRPVLAMPVGDLPALIHNSHCGLLAQSVSAKDYACAIQKLLSSSTNDFTIGVNLQSKKFELNQIVIRILQETIMHEN
jgi:glycosyltransferase involved in cell wall biosynthesis